MLLWWRVDGGTGYKEEEDLVVFQGTTEPQKGHHEQEDAHADDPCHHPKTGNEAEPFTPGRHSNHQQAHHLRKTMSGDERGLCGEGSTLNGAPSC